MREIIPWCPLWTRVPKNYLEYTVADVNEDDNDEGGEQKFGLPRVSVHFYQH